MKKLYESGDLVDVQLLRAYLENSNITVSIQNHQQASTPGAPHWALRVNAELWVKDDNQQEEAVALIRQFRKEQAEGSAKSLQSWSCPKCREENPGTFEICWSCGNASRTRT